MRALATAVFAGLLATLASVGCATGVDDKPVDDGTRPSQDVTCAAGQQSSMTAFTSGPLYPSAMCIGVDDVACAANDGTTIVSCNGTAGVCLAAGAHQLCLPQCSFDDSGGAPKGCSGKDVCNVYGWGRDSGKVYGIGYCFGGCRADHDCPTGSSCQIEEGLCVTTKKSYPKIAGMPCTKAEATGTSPSCNCMYGTSSGKGYCANFCVVGGSSCGAGSVCSPQLATSDDTGALFSRDPQGMAGNCLRTCATDAECAPLNALCKTTASGKVCQPS